MKVLLIISCSKKKAEELHKGKMKAENAYIGPMYQVINKAKREGRWGDKIFLGIVSAKYGFLRSNDKIEYYDLRMTKELAEKHNPSVLSQILKWHQEEKFDVIHVLMGMDYIKTVEGLEKMTDTHVIIENMGGTGYGQQKLVRIIEKFAGKPKGISEYLE